MIKIIKPLLIAFIFTLCSPLAAQTPAYDDLTMESDEITDTYHASGTKYAFLRSKKGVGGMTHTSTGDSIKTFSIKEIVLVFTETTEAAYDEREDANKERWENLLKTYPEFFQTNTVYKSICQCNLEGNAEAFKHAQGFYVYFVGKSAPAVVEKVAEVKKVEEKKVDASTSSATEKVVEKKVEKAAEKKEEKVVDASTGSATKKEEKKVEEKKVEEKVAEKKEEKKAEKKAEEKVVKEEAKPVEKAEPEEAHEEVVKVVPQKKAGIGKQRRARDPKACRPACYEGGDDDLNNYFKTAISLTKKERRHVKHLSSTVKIYLNHDGSIKKSLVTGEDEMLNKKLTGAVNAMSNWNPAVKNGLTIKSEVKITIKFDREFKGMKPSEVAFIPKPGPKCKCTSDAEMFGPAD